MSSFHLLHGNHASIWDQKTGVLFLREDANMPGSWARSTALAGGVCTSLLSAVGVHRGSSVKYTSAHSPVRAQAWVQFEVSCEICWVVWTPTLVNISSHSKTIMTNATQLEEVIGRVQGSRGYLRLCFWRKESCMKIEWFVNPQRRCYI